MICTGNPNQIWECYDIGISGGWITRKSEREILETMYDWWSKEMFLIGKLLLATEENCIDDWIVVNWALKVKQDKN